MDTFRLLYISTPERQSCLFSNSFGLKITSNLLQWELRSDWEDRHLLKDLLMNELNLILIHVRMLCPKTSVYYWHILCTPLKVMDLNTGDLCQTANIGSRVKNLNKLWLSKATIDLSVLIWIIGCVTNMEVQGSTK